MAWLLTLVPRDPGHRDHVVRKLTAAFPAIRWDDFRDLPLATREMRERLRRRGHPISGDLREGQLTIHFGFPDPPESVRSIDIKVHGEGQPLPILRALAGAIDGT